jgi:DNA-binding MarR family transcriptional regulator
MSFKFTDAVFKITNNGNYCLFCNKVFAGGTIAKRKRKGKMQDKVLTAEEELVEHSKTHPFGHVEKAVLLALADHANDDGICWPGYTLLSAETYLSRASVSTAIANLSEMNLITITEKSKRRSTVYKLNIETDPAVIDANHKKAMDAAGIEPPVMTVRMGGKTYRRKPKEEVEFLDESKASTTAFNIEDEDDELA